LLWLNQVQPLTLHHPSSRSATSVWCHATMSVLTCHLHGCLQLKQCAKTPMHVQIHRTCRINMQTSLPQVCQYMSVHVLLSVCKPNVTGGCNVLPKTVFFCSPAANAHACSIRALRASVIRLVGCQKHDHHHHDSLLVPRLAWQQQERSLAAMQT